MATTFTWQPTKNSPKKKQPRVKKVEFGNGYKQIYGDGINNNLENWSLVFEVEDTVKQAIESFLDTANGYNFFNWTSPENGATEKQYVCPSWESIPIGGGFYSLTAIFEEWPGLV